MALRFNPYPYRNDRPSGSDTAAAISQSLASLGQTAATIAQANRQREQDALALRLQQEELMRTGGRAAVERVYGQKAAGPAYHIKMFNKTAPDPTMPALPDNKLKMWSRPAVVPPQFLPAGKGELAPYGASDFDADAYRYEYGENALKTIRDEEDRKRAALTWESEQQRRAAQTAKDLADAQKTMAGGLTPEQQYRLEDRRQKMADADSRLNVPGYTRPGTVRPKEDEAAKMRDSVARLDKFEKGVSLLKELTNKHGSFEYFGSSGATMNGLATDLQLDAKELYNLGVLNGPDLMLIQKAIADPSSTRSVFTRKGTRQAELDLVLKRMREGVAAKASSMGYSPEGAHVASPQTPTTKTINGVTYQKIDGKWYAQ